MNALKKIMLAVMIIAVGFCSANAQFRFGVKAGLNLNKLDVKDVKSNFDKENGCGWTAGVMTEFQVPVIGICVDLSLMYTRMNADPTITGSNADFISYNKNFLQVPLNLKYKLSLPAISHIVAPYIFTGPDFAFKLDKNMVNTLKTKTCQVAWNVGLGVELIKHLQVGASYGFGINNIVEKTGLDKITGINADDIKLKNNYWTITAAYLF